jgi:hypothetical protein
MLESLARYPKVDEYKTAGGRNTQVFAFTSFGVHWHILVGYRRPRLEREYEGTEGVSEMVYVWLLLLFFCGLLRLKDLVA